MKIILSVVLTVFNLTVTMASSLADSCEDINLSEDIWRLIIPAIPMQPRTGDHLKNIPLDIEIKSNASLKDFGPGLSIYGVEKPMPSKLFTVSTNSPIEEYNHFNYLFLVDQPEFGCTVYLIRSSKTPITWKNIWNELVLNYVIEKDNTHSDSFNLRDVYDGFESIASTLSLKN